ncbi:hypothetical protein BDN72DRAFT_850509 [Pluteus cervinus]|uniref:Uncharacterized protein n=1 Tax=Pluteus cervinus TaxID=181527 RepID=A0ACD3A489_9AGAR|nr:hypothetical protein BDN72DRAFT_850509 [Pluteus cervinus]
MVAAGTYTITLSRPNSLLTVPSAGERAMLLGPEDEGQQWDIRAGDSDDTYVIKSTFGEYYLGYEGDAANHVQLTGTPNATAWKINAADDGKYGIIAAADDNWVASQGFAKVFPAMVTLLSKDMAYPPTSQWALNKV